MLTVHCPFNFVEVHSRLPTTIRQEIFMVHTNVRGLGIDSHTICMEMVKCLIFVERAPAKSMKIGFPQKFLA